MVNQECHTKVNLQNDLKTSLKHLTLWLTMATPVLGFTLPAMFKHIGSFCIYSVLFVLCGGSWLLAAHILAIFATCLYEDAWQSQVNNNPPAERSALAKRQLVHREKTKKAMGRLRRILHLSQAESALFVLEQAAQYIEYAEQRENRMPGFRPMADLLPKPVAPKGPISDSVLTLLGLCCDENFENNWATTMYGGPEIINAQLGKLINE